MELRKYDVLEKSNSGVEFELKDPASGKSLGIFFCVRGKESDTFMDTLAAQRKRRVLESAASGSTKPVEPKEATELGIELLATCTVYWADRSGKYSIPEDGRDPNTIELDGKWVACNVINASTVYQRFPWIRDQIDTEALNIANFMRG